MHMQNMHNKTLPKAKGFQCENCNETFFNPEYWIIHREKCGVDKNHARIPCALCNKRYSRKDRLKEHMNRVHGAGSFDKDFYSVYTRDLLGRYTREEYRARKGGDAEGVVGLDFPKLFFL